MECTTRPLGEHLRQVSKKSNKWSRRRCDNETVTVLSKGKIAILKMATIRPYLLTDQNRFLGGHIWTLRGIHIKGFGKIPQVVSDEMP